MATCIIIIVNDKIVLTDENFEIPKIYTVISGENVADYYEYIVVDKNGEKRIISKIIDVWEAKEIIHEDRARYFDNYKQLRDELAGRKKNDRNYGQQRNGRRNLAEDSAVERKVQSEITVNRRSKRQLDIPKGYTKRAQGVILKCSKRTGKTSRNKC